MENVCRACGYQRKPTDQAADWECPACGKAYAKTPLDSSSALSLYVRSPVARLSTSTKWGPWSIACLILGVACAPFFVMAVWIQTDVYHATDKPLPPDRVIPEHIGRNNHTTVYATAAERSRDKRLEKLIFMPGILVFAGFAFACKMAKYELGD